MSIEAMKQALEALEDAMRSEKLKYDHPMYRKAITSLRQAIAEEEKQEAFCDNNCVWTDHHPDCVKGKA